METEVIEIQQFQINRWISPDNFNCENNFKHNGLFLVIYFILVYFPFKLIRNTSKKNELNFLAIKSKKGFKTYIISTAIDNKAIIVRLIVGLIFLSEGVQKYLFPELLGTGRFLKIGFSNPELLTTQKLELCQYLIKKIQPC